MFAFVRLRASQTLLPREKRIKEMKMKNSHKKEVKMKKFLPLCVVMSLMFLFTAPALTADVTAVDLGSNLSFTFEPSSTMEKSLILIPFTSSPSTLLQEAPTVEIKKDNPVPFIFALGVTLVAVFTLKQLNS